MSTAFIHNSHTFIKLKGRIIVDNVDKVVHNVKIKAFYLWMNYAQMCNALRDQMHGRAVGLSNAPSVRDLTS